MTVRTLNRLPVILTLALTFGCPDPSTPTTTEPTPTPTGTTPTPVTPITPMDCAPEFQYDTWSIVEDRTLVKACSPYILSNDASVSNGATVTIEPGVVVQVAGSSWFEVGDGTLVASGTVDDPVVFTSTEGTPTPGSWLGLKFTSSARSGSSLTHTTIEYAGQDAFGQKGCMTISGPEQVLALDNVTFANCDQGGLYATSDALVSATGLVFQDLDGYGLSLAPDAVGVLDEVFTYEEVDFNAIHTGAVTTSATWIDQTVPWRVSGDLDVNGESDPTLTLEAGVTLQFENDSYLDVSDGLIANGTPAAPVVFESSEPSPLPGSWLGVMFRNDILNGSLLNNVVVRHGGADAFGMSGCVTILDEHQGRLSIVDSTFESCAQAGVGQEQADFSFGAFTNNTFSDLPYGFDLRPNAVGSIAAGQVFIDTPAVRIDGGPVDRTATWLGQDVPFEVFGDIDVGSDSDPILTLAEGVTLQFEASQWLEVGSGGNAGIIIQGSPASPVVLESMAALPAAGDWLGLNLDSSLLNGSSIDYLVLRHAGQADFGQKGCLHVDGDHRGRLTVTNSVFSDCFGAGIAATGEEFTFADLSFNEFVDSPYGLRIRPDAVGSIGSPQTYTNTPANRIDDGTVSTTQTWVDQGVPFDVFGSIDVQDDSDPVLTIEAGSELLFEASEYLNIGSGANGGLVVAGTATNRVHFGSQQANPTPGSWLGLRLRTNTLNGTVIDYAHITDAGQDAFGQGGAITMTDVGATVTVSNTTFANNSQVDVWCDDDSSPTLTGLGAATILCPAP